MRRVSLEEQADAILKRHDGMAWRPHDVLGERFEPFKLIKPYGRMSGPVAPGAQCENCAGPSRKGESICRACAQAQTIYDFAAVADYWMTIGLGCVPDFSLVLIDSITARELELGLPAARWPTSETAGVTT